MFKLLNAQLFEKATRLPEKFEKTHKTPPCVRPADGSFACNALSVDLSSLRIQRLNGGIVHLYYFAYGSNMNWEQMQRRCPSTRFVCVASLKDYRFAIARHP